MGNLNYGVIGNCCTAALISEKGSIEWLCFPNFDSPSIFAALLDREKGGTFGFEVSEDYHTIYNPQIEMFARFKMKSSFHKTKRII